MIGLREDRDVHVQTGFVVADHHLALTVHRQRRLIEVVNPVADHRVLDNRLGGRVYDIELQHRRAAARQGDGVDGVDLAVVLPHLAGEPVIGGIDVPCAVRLQGQIVRGVRGGVQQLGDGLGRPGAARIVDVIGHRPEVVRAGRDDVAAVRAIGLVHALDREAVVLAGPIVGQRRHELLHGQDRRRAAGAGDVVAVDHVQRGASERIARRAAEIVGADIDGLAVDREGRIVGDAAGEAGEGGGLPAARGVGGVRHGDGDGVEIGAEAGHDPLAGRFVEQHPGVAVGEVLRAVHPRLAGRRPELAVGDQLSLGARRLVINGIGAVGGLHELGRAHGAHGVRRDFAEIAVQGPHIHLRDAVDAEHHAERLCADDLASEGPVRAEVEGIRAQPGQAAVIVEIARIAVVGVGDNG